MEGLTLKQQAILQFINRTIHEKGYAPSYREIMDHFQLASLGSVFQYLQTLEKKGVIRKNKLKHRGIELSEGHQKDKQSLLQTVPWIGNLSIGYPLELFRQPQYMSVPDYLLHEPENTYLLQVQGDSLQPEGLYDEDFLLIESRQNITPGEIVLGIINNTDSFLKKYYPEAEHIRLVSQNNLISPLTVRGEHIIIQGVLVGMFRLY